MEICGNKWKDFEMNFRLLTHNLYQLYFNLISMYFN
jgi:hypothetical protein